jgi:GNAT superfamily N-acetyltransferase
MENFLITEDYIHLDNGILEYYFDDDCAVVNQISVGRTGEGIGSALVERLEQLAIEENISFIEVPISPTKQTLIFWQKKGYQLQNPDDNYLVQKLLNSSYEGHFETTQGVFVAYKNL